jgi:branched-chain amino acid transport system substrate-binding protein
MRRIGGSVPSVVAAIVVASVMLAAPKAGAGSPPTPGVTATTVRIGIPYVDLASLSSVGVKLTQGSFPDAYNALIANVNAHGGINGRKIVPYLVAVNPTGTAPAATACTQLTEDDKVFVALSPLSPDCYLEQHHTPTIASQFQGALPPGSAPNFTLAAPPSAYDPLQLSVFDKEGVFKGKKVGIYGTSTDQPEIQVVKSALQKLHVDVVETGVNTAPATDQTAVNQIFDVVAQRFQNAGANEVVAVGQGSAGWPQGLAANQISYNPNWVATNESSVAGYAGSAADAAPYLSKVVTSTPGLSGLQVWHDPGIQKCVAIIHKAYPSDKITPYDPNANSSDHSYVSPEGACETLALFEVIAKAAGKDLTVQSFTRAGESLKNFTIPASGGAVSFAPGRPFALGPVYVGHYDPSTHLLVFSSKSATS